MPKYDDETKYSALSLLNQGISAAEVSGKVKVPMTTVLRWDKELKEAKTGNNLDKLINLDKIILQELADEVINNSSLDIEETVKNVVEKVNNLEKLGEELQITASQITQQVRRYVMVANDPTDLVVLSDILCKLQEAFFNSNATQINVQNNIGGYSDFLSDTPISTQ